MFLEQYRLLIYVFNKVMRNTISIKFLMKRYKKKESPSLVRKLNYKHVSLSQQRAADPFTTK